MVILGEEERLGVVADIAATSETTARLSVRAELREVAKYSRETFGALLRWQITRTLSQRVYRCLGSKLGHPSSKTKAILPQRLSLNFAHQRFEFLGESLLLCRIIRQIIIAVVVDAIPGVELPSEGLRVVVEEAVVEPYPDFLFPAAELGCLRRTVAETNSAVLGADVLPALREAVYTVPAGEIVGSREETF